MALLRFKRHFKVYLEPEQRLKSTQITPGASNFPSPYYLRLAEYSTSLTFHFFVRSSFRTSISVLLRFAFLTFCFCVCPFIPVGDSFARGSANRSGSDRPLTNDCAKVRKQQQQQ